MFADIFSIAIGLLLAANPYMPQKICHNLFKLKWLFTVCILFGCLEFISIHAQAKAAKAFPAIDRLETDRLIMRDQNCESLSKEVDAIERWQQLRGTPKNCPKKVERKQTYCEIDITDCVPREARLLHDAPLKHSGPNCFNNALYMAKLLPITRLVMEDEAFDYLDSPLCTKLNNHQNPQPGDVVAMFETNTTYDGSRSSQWNDLYHTMIYISARLNYSKQGYGSQYPYELISASDIQKQFSAVAKTRIAVYRCQPFSDFLRKTPNLQSQVLYFFSLFTTFEKRAFKFHGLKAEEHNRLREELISLSLYATDLFKSLSREKLDSNSLFVLSTTSHKIYAIQKEFKFKKFLTDEYIATNQPADFAIERLNLLHAQLKKFLRQNNVEVF